MTSTSGSGVLSKLSDSGQTVSSADEDIRGRTVMDKDGNDVGKVDDLLIDDEEHKVRFLVVEHGGFLGIGETKSFIPVDAITRVSDREVEINHSREHVTNGPRYDPKLVNDEAYLDSVYGHYGYTPFWAAGYSYPYFPGF